MGWAKSSSHQPSSRKEEKADHQRQKALEKEFARGGDPSARHSCLASRAMDVPLARCPSERGSLQARPAADPGWSPGALGGPPASGLPSETRGALELQGLPPSALTTVPDQDMAPQVRRAPEASFTPTAAGLRPESWQDQDMPPSMRHWISSAIKEGIAEGLQQQPRQEVYLPNRADLWEYEAAYQDPGSRSRDSQRSLLEGERLEEGEQDVPGRPSFKGLFNPALFHQLLAKARATAKLGKDSGLQETASEAGVQEDYVFTERTTALDCIPIPEMFLDVIKKQWSNPALATRPSNQESSLFCVDSDLEQLVQVPRVDSPVAALASSSVFPPDAEDALKGDEKKEEMALRRAHLADSWAIRAATAASFFTRASVCWLRQLQGRISPEDLRAHQDLSKIVAAAEYTADASLAAAKFSARAMAASVTARRLLWLRYWSMDSKNKWKLVSAPFEGDSLFGPSLDPLLIETRDKRKVLPSRGRRADFPTSPYFRRPSFRQRGAGPGFPPQQRPFFPRSDYPSDRPSFRGRQQGQRSFRGSSGPTLP